MNQSIAFTNRAGQRIAGTIVEDYGHAFLVKISDANRKNYIGRTMLFAKNDMPILALGFDQGKAA